MKTILLTILALFLCTVSFAQDHATFKVARKKESDSATIVRQLIGTWIDMAKKENVIAITFTDSTFCIGAKEAKDTGKFNYSGHYTHWVLKSVRSGKNGKFVFSYNTINDIKCVFTDNYTSLKIYFKGDIGTRGYKRQ